MKKIFNVTIDEEKDEVTINGEKCFCDKSFKGETGEKALVSLANELGYEPIGVFEEIVDLLEKQIKENYFYD